MVKLARAVNLDAEAAFLAGVLMAFPGLLAVEPEDEMEIFSYQFLHFSS